VTSNLFPLVNLTEIFRQADTSQIVVAAHAINRGDTPAVKTEPGAEFSLISASDESKVLDIVVKIAARLYDKRENFQVMSPRHAGTVGVTQLNARLRDLLNQKQKGLQEMRIGSEVIREEDRVMVVKNNYDLEIFNGDVGKVSRLDRKNKVIEVKIHGPPVQYVRIPFKDAAEYLRLAYAVTVHKSQGLEYDTVVLPLVLGFSHQLQRNLFYTAITRARKRVILVGQHEAMVRAINNNRPDGRNTLFLDRLQTIFADPTFVVGPPPQPLVSA
jgi:exodeoxyribonuclease V alpha subunit